jgi:Asp-tRNA(Asn)/Glu-tRNA(Gln) amidotransferase A subunit family amidase
LRIPGHFSGICSLKPSYHRLSHLGSTSCKPVYHEIEVLSGPMSGNVSNLIHFCRQTFGHSAHDVVPLIFKETLFEQKQIKFGFCVDDPFITASPACIRAVRDAVSVLKQSGFEVVEFKYPTSFSRLMPLFYELISADGWEFYFKQLQGEMREPVLKNLLRYAALPNWMKFLVSRTAGLFLRDSSAVSLLRAISSKSSFEILKARIEVKEIAIEFQDFFFNSGMDVILSPCHVLPATPNGSFGDIHFCAVHTFAWNLLNQPIGVLPVGKFSSEIDCVDGEWPRPFKFKSIFSKTLLQRVAQHYYAASCIDGLPIGIQVIGRSNQDELVLAAMSKLESILKNM